jgi:hypothetical protein
MNARLISFVSLRNYKHSRKRIKKELPDALVLPMFPGIKNWRMNIHLLRMALLFKKTDVAIGRSVLATQLLLKIKNGNRLKKVVYDGRGAISAEWKEYGVVNDPVMLGEIDELEKTAVIRSDYRIAVSQQLVAHWSSAFGYNSDKHSVIPCTINQAFEKATVSAETIVRSRHSLGLEEQDIVFAYAGSSAGWQSFQLLDEFMRAILMANAFCKLIFLSKMSEGIQSLQDTFPGRVICKEADPQQVPDYLVAADYGLLIREESVTNQVASPVKFAEYLACGLKVIISDKLGDYTAYVQQNDCGYMFTDIKDDLSKISLEKKQALNRMAVSHFSKSAFKKQYELLIQ